MNPDKYKEPKRKFDNFIRYSSMGIEMVTIMGIGVFAGIKIDQWLELDFPAFTLGLMVFAVAGAIYRAVRKFL